jgi:hypothetical protein
VVARVDRFMPYGVQAHMTVRAVTFRVNTNASLLLACLSLAGCGPSDPPSPTPSSNDVQVSSECESNIDRRYFPGRSAAVESQALAAMHEPSLSCGIQPDSYRVLWFTAFSGGGLL